MYQYAGYDPVNKSDPLGLYEYDTHNYLTRYLAERAGFTPEEAGRIGFETQQLDMDERVATEGGVSHENMYLYHFVTPDRLIAMRRKAHSGGSLSESYTAIGEFLHAWEDSYSHQRDLSDHRFDEQYQDFEPVFDLGHGLHGHNPDWTWERPRLAMRMAESTYRQLVLFCQSYKSDCQPADFDSFRHTIEEFVKFEPPQYLRGGVVPAVGDYREKIRILDDDYRVTAREFQKYIVPFLKESIWKQIIGGYERLLSDPTIWMRLAGAP